MQYSHGSVTNLVNLSFYYRLCSMVLELTRHRSRFWNAYIFFLPYFHVPALQTIKQNTKKHGTCLMGLCSCTVDERKFGTVGLMVVVVGE